MCRLTALISGDEEVLLADITTEPNMSIIRQSYACQERQQLPQGTVPSESYKQAFLNGDGYGIGWYDINDIKQGGEGACVFVSSAPAWNDSNLAQLSDRVRSHLIFAHVRAAGPSTPVGQSLCHPFRCGKFIFMHNGVIGGFNNKGVQRPLLSLLNDISFDIAMRHSSIDSAVAFALFLTQLCPKATTIQESYGKCKYDADDLRKAMEATVLIIRHTCEKAYKDNKQPNHNLPSSLANFVVSDGNTIIATRYAWGGGDDGEGTGGVPVASCSLYYITGSKWSCITPNRGGEGEGGVNDNYHMIHTDPRPRVAIVSSEPLNTLHDEWTPVPHNHTLVLMTKPNTDIVTVLLAPLMKRLWPSIDKPCYCSCCEKRSIMIRASSSAAFRETAYNTQHEQNRGRDEDLSARGGGVDDIYNIINTHPIPDIAAGPTTLGDIITTLSPNDSVTNGYNNNDNNNIKPYITGLDDPFMELKASTTTTTVNRGDSGKMVNSGGYGRGDGYDMNNTVCSMDIIDGSSLGSLIKVNNNIIIIPAILVVGFQDGHIRFYDTNIWDILDIRKQTSPVVTIASSAASPASSSSSSNNNNNTTTTHEKDKVDDSNIEHKSNILHTSSTRRRRASSSRSSSSNLLFTGGDNELRIWDITYWVMMMMNNNKRRHSNNNKEADDDEDGKDMASSSSSSSTTTTTKTPCLFCIKFNPNPGRILSLAVNNNTDYLYAGFNNTSLISINVPKLMKSLRSIKTKSKTIKFLTIDLNVVATSCDGGGGAAGKGVKGVLNDNIISDADDNNNNDYNKVRCSSSKDYGGCGKKVAAATTVVIGKKRARLQETSRECVRILKGSGNNNNNNNKAEGNGISRQHYGPVTCLLPYKYGILSGSSDGQLLWWPPSSSSPRTGYDDQEAYSLVGHRGAIFCLASTTTITSTSKEVEEVYSGSSDGTIRIWGSRNNNNKHLLWNCRRTLYHYNHAGGISKLSGVSEEVKDNNKSDHDDHDDISSSSYISSNTNAVLSLAVVNTYYNKVLLISSSLTHLCIWNNNKELLAITSITPPQGGGAPPHIEYNHASFFFPAKLLSLGHSLPNWLAIAGGGDRVRIFRLTPPPPGGDNDNNNNRYDDDEYNIHSRRHSLLLLDGDNSSTEHGGGGGGGGLIDERSWLVDFIKQCGSYRSETLLNKECLECANFISLTMEDIGFSVRLINEDDIKKYEPDLPKVAGGGGNYERGSLIAADNNGCSSINMNPVIIARLGWDISSSSTIILYSHYDVVPSLSDNAYIYKTINGRIYGRGAADCKGPLGAQLLAIKRLIKEQEQEQDNNINNDEVVAKLPNIVMICEGMEERGSNGFQGALRWCILNNWIGINECINAVIATNSQWILDEDKPCICYAMRGVIDITIQVVTRRNNKEYVDDDNTTTGLLSGIHGGVICEPLLDIMYICNTLVDSTGLICIPQFYDDVRESTYYDDNAINNVTNTIINTTTTTTRRNNDKSADIADRLRRTWLLPSLSILDVSTGILLKDDDVDDEGKSKKIYKNYIPAGHCAHTRIIPQVATANVSIRYVPNQDGQKLINLIDKHVKHEFMKRRSNNSITVKANSCWNYWESKGVSTSTKENNNENNKHLNLLLEAKKAVMKAWHVDDVLLVREGGSMAVLSLLQETLNSPTVQIPLATPKDRPHEEGESIPISNLIKGAQVIQNLINQLQQQQQLELGAC